MSLYRQVLRFNEYNHNSEHFIKITQLQNTDLERPLTDLIRLLTGDYDDDISKVRALYRWFTSQQVSMPAVYNIVYISGTSEMLYLHSD